MSLLNSIIHAFLIVLLEALSLYKLAVIVFIILTWLVAYDMVNTRHRFVRMVMDFLYRITEPVLRPIRRVIPPIGGIDLSPIVLFFIIYFLQLVIGSQLAQLAMYP